jgi:Spy/CpxP family protein refolding chaperone
MSAPQRGSARAKVIALVLAVFALGAVTGAALDSAYRLGAAGSLRAPQPSPREDFFELLQKNLDLDARQAAEVRAIVDETREGYRQLRTEVRPRYETLRANGRARIRALLTPEQQQKFDRMTAERDARRAASDERGRP